MERNTEEVKLFFEDLKRYEKILSGSFKEGFSKDFMDDPAFIELEEMEDNLAVKILEFNDGYEEAELAVIIDKLGLNLEDPSFEEGFKEARTSWKDYLHLQQTNITYLFQPDNLSELVSNIEYCYQKNIFVKPYGARHSSSDVAKPIENSAALTLEKLKLYDTLDQRKLTSSLGEKLVQFEAGYSVKQVNDILHSMGYALPNMGSYDKQSLIGAICTGTHGSNREVGPMANIVKAIDLLMYEDGILKNVRVQPTSCGLPDHSELIEVRANDNLFYNLVLSMGSIGVIYNVVIAVEEKFMLKETRKVTSWSEVKSDFNDLLNGEFVDLIINPNRRKKKNFVMLTKRTRTNDSNIIPKPQFTDLKRKWQKFAAKHTRISNALFTLALRRRVKRNNPSVDHSFNIFLLGGGKFQATSIEIAIPVEKAVEAIDSILILAKLEEKKGNVHTAPIGVRFVSSSLHKLSFAYGKRVCTIEIPLLKWQKDSNRILKMYYDLLINNFDGKPHWGQLNWGKYGEYSLAYGDNFTNWVNLFKSLNVPNIFSNSFTERITDNDEDLLSSG
ncbi:MAG: hypothetical protein ACI9O4_001740 [Chitinophagales bacterium]|jgi:hypothetical protein